jgi:hypothetical protein
MTVPVKPTESLTWAESGPPSLPGSTTPTEPTSGLKATGYGFEQPLPHSEFNWLFRTLNRWMRWVTEKMDLHVHDGGSNPESVAKVDLKDHIDYGTNGYLEVTQDTSGGHRIAHKSDTSAPTRFTADTLRAESLLVSDEIRPKSAASILVSDPLLGVPSVPVVALNTIKARGQVNAATPAFRGNSNYGFASITSPATGLFDLTLASPPASANAIVAIATLNMIPAGGERIGAEVLSNSVIRVTSVDSAGAIPYDFSIMVMYTV